MNLFHHYVSFKILSGKQENELLKLMCYLSLMLLCVTMVNEGQTLVGNIFYFHFKVSTTLGIFLCCLKITRVCMLEMLAFYQLLF